VGGQPPMAVGRRKSLPYKTIPVSGSSSIRGYVRAGAC
jgi:hypothetical protein